MFRKSCLLVLIIVSLFALVSCSAQTAQERPVIKETETETDYGKEAERIVKEYLSSQQFAVKYRVSEGVYENRYSRYYVPSVSNADIASAQLGYIADQIGKVVDVQYNLTGLHTEEMAVNDYRITVGEGVQILYPGQETAEIEERTWEFLVHCDDDSQYISSVELCSVEKDTREDVYHLDVKQFAENKAASYLYDRSDTINCISGMKFDDLLIHYFAPDTPCIDAQRRYVDEKKREELFTRCLYTDAQTEVYDSNNYRVRITMHESIAAEEGAEPVEEVSRWLINVTVSDNGIYITNIEEEPQSEE